MRSPTWDPFCWPSGTTRTTTSAIAPRPARTSGDRGWSRCQSPRSRRLRRYEVVRVPLVAAILAGGDHRDARHTHHLVAPEHPQPGGRGAPRQRAVVGALGHVHPAKILRPRPQASTLTVSPRRTRPGATTWHHTPKVTSSLPRSRARAWRTGTSRAPSSGSLVVTTR